MSRRDPHTGHSTGNNAIIIGHEIRVAQPVDIHEHRAQDRSDRLLNVPEAFWNRGTV